MTPGRNTRKVPMLSTPTSSPLQPADDREARIQALLDALRQQADPKLRQMAERLVDLPEDKAFGQIEHDLGDLARQVAADAHQAGLDTAKKRAM